MDPSPLPRRAFGKTGLKPTAIGLGGAVLTKQSYRDGVATVRRALELGVGYFDTSPGYCNNQSQPVMGDGLAGAPADTVVATKVGYFTDPRDFRNPSAIRRQISDNLRLLGRERVDVLQVHEANMSCWWEDGASSPWEQIREDRDYDFASAPVLAVLREARQAGICRAIGVTGNVARQMSRVLRTVDVDTFLVAFNYDPIARNAEEEAFPLAAERGVALIVGAIFYGGRLTAVHPEWLQAPPPWMAPSLRERFARLYVLQNGAGMSLVQLAVRFVLARAGISVVLIGAATPQEIEESVEAARAGPLPPELHAAVEELGTREALR